MAPLGWEVTFDPPRDGDCAAACVVQLLKQLGEAGRAAGRVWPTTPQQVRDELCAFMRANLDFFSNLVVEFMTADTPVVVPLDALEARLADLVRPGVHMDGLDLTVAALLFGFDLTVPTSDTEAPPSLRALLRGWHPDALPPFARTEPAFHAVVGLYQLHYYILARLPPPPAPHGTGRRVFFCGGVLWPIFFFDRYVRRRPFFSHASAAACRSTVPDPWLQYERDPHGHRHLVDVAADHQQQRPPRPPRRSGRRRRRRQQPKQEQLLLQEQQQRQRQQQWQQRWQQRQQRQRQQRQRQRQQQGGTTTRRQRRAAAKVALRWLKDQVDTSPRTPTPPPPPPSAERVALLLRCKSMMRAFRLARLPRWLNANLFSTTGPRDTGCVHASVFPFDSILRSCSCPCMLRPFL
jgi:hypothetical protein